LCSLAVPGKSSEKFVMGRKASPTAAEICHKILRNLLLAPLPFRFQIQCWAGVVPTALRCTLVTTKSTEEVMKNLLAVLTAVLFLGSVGAALADEAKGKIQAVDPTARTIQMEDGTIFTVAEAVAMDALQPGTEVTVSFEEKDGQKTATAVAPAQ